MLDDDTLRRWVEEIQVEFDALNAGKMAEYVGTVRSDVVEWRWADVASNPHRPDPWWSKRREPPMGADAGWSDHKANAGEVFADRVGFDAVGRPLLVERGYGNEFDPLEAWEHRDERSVLRRFDNGAHGGDPVPTIVFYDNLTRPSAIVIADVAGQEIFVPKPSVRTERWRWDGEFPVEGVVTGVGPDEFPGATGTYRVEMTDSGQPAVLWFENRAVWMAPADLRATEELVPLLTDGLVAALLAGVSASGVERPWVIDHRSGAGTDRSGADEHLPGFARVGGEDFRDAMRASTAEDGAALDLLFTGEGRGAAIFDVIDFCDPETQRACGELNSAMAMTRDLEDAETQRAYAIAEAVADGVTERLNAAAVVSGSVQPFGALTGVGARFGADEGLDRAKRVLGPAWAQAFEAAMASTVGATDVALPPAAFHDRAALAGVLSARGIEGADEIVATHAQPGFRLVPRRSGGLRGLLGRSGPKPVARLLGSGMLPPGEAWPRTVEGRVLAFLAAVDLSALEPVLEGGPALPQAGWMLFFADVDDPAPPSDYSDPDAPDWDALTAGEGSFYGEPTPNTEGATARMFWVPPGVEPVAGKPPSPRDSKHAPKEIALTAVHQLTLQAGYSAGEDLGLGPGAAAAYDEIAEAVNGGEDSDDWSSSHDWVLGNVTGVQGEELDEDTVLLLHLASVEFQDGGAIQFRIPTAGLQAQDWAQVYAIADSH